jgi:glycosyltransferase involved in cell wall biosynthesis
MSADDDRHERQQPLVSVVIPVKDDAEHLRACLAALAEQTVEPFEIIVVDNGSTDDSALVAVAGGASVVAEATPGIPAAASAGYDSALGDVIARLDADSVPPRDWIQRIAGHFEADPDLGAVTGPGVFPELGGASNALARTFYMDAYFVLVGAALANWPVFGSNFAMRSDAWRTVRCSVHRDDPEVHDDMDLSVFLGRSHTIRLDRGLAVPISARPFGDVRSMWKRNRRAFHTLRVAGRDASSVRRWRARLLRDR